MCGLYGIIGKGIIKLDHEVFRALGIVSLLRGMDGAGIFETNSGSNRDDKFHKVGGDFTYLLYDMQYEYQKDREGKRKLRKEHFLTSTIPDMIMGHNRAATRGGYHADNSHPFNLERYVAAHNGTLVDKDFQSKDITDSELMFREMEASGIVEVLSKLSPQSAWALTIWDKVEKKLIFGRNALRGLYFTVHNDRRVMYWASEEGILNYVLKKYDINHGTIFQFATDRLSSVRPGDVLAGKDAFFRTIWDRRKEEEARREAAKSAEAAQEGKTTPKVTSRYQSVPEIKQQHQSRIHFGPVSKVTPEKVDTFEPFDVPAFLKASPSSNTSSLFDDLQDDNVVQLHNRGGDNTSTAVRIYENTSLDKKLRHRYLHCTCGLHHLNVLDSYRTRIGWKGYPVFDKKEGAFKCTVEETKIDNKIIIQ